jgi:hypothetical protein
MAEPESPKLPVSPLLLGTVFMYALVLGWYFHVHDEAPPPVPFSTEGLKNVVSTMGPLFAIAAFIERAVEIVIATTRGPHTLELQRALDGAHPKERGLRRALDHYKLQTQRISFGISLALSVAAALSGVRSVSPLLAPSVGATRWFDLFDVTLTSLLLAGGSDGIHQVVTTITSFLDASKSGSQRKSLPPPPPAEHKEREQDQEPAPAPAPAPARAPTPAPEQK